MNDKKPTTAEKLQRFTKSELIAYICQMEFALSYNPPYKALLDISSTRMFNEIDENLKQQKTLISKCDPKCEIDMDILIQLAKLRDDLRKLVKKRDAIMNELYPDRQFHTD